MPPILVLLGPTASGKSALALEVCEQIGGEIISCDSQQIYRECDIVTAKPTPAERAQIRHHLLDICAPTERFSAALWALRAREAVESIEARGKIPVICGGTGFYFQALISPEKIAAPAPDETLREELEARLQTEGAEILRAELARLEPEIAAKIESGDNYRLIRALQIELQKARGDAVLQAAPFEREMKVFALEWPREILIERIHSRVDAMLQTGALDETRGLWEKYGAEAFALGSVGYKQLIPVLRGEDSLENAVEKWKIATRQYAKRQMTWLRGQTNAVWLAGGVEENCGRIMEALQPL